MAKKLDSFQVPNNKVYALYILSTSLANGWLYIVDG